MIPGSRDKLTVKAVQDMRGKEQIVMFCRWDPWLAAAVEAAGVHILRCPTEARQWTAGTNEGRLGTQPAS